MVFFWHRHANCKYTSTPKSRINFWEHKFHITQCRDKKEQDILTEAGWNVIIVWECEIKYKFDETITNVISSITSYSC